MFFTYQRGKKVMSGWSRCIVPSGPTPSKEEWTTHFWYHLITTAAQANAACKEEEAHALVAIIQNYFVTLPCVDCKGHYLKYVTEHPFTLEHAHDIDKAIDWVLTLRAAIAARVAKEGQEAVAAASSSKPSEPLRSRQKSCVPAAVPGPLFDEARAHETTRKEANELIARVKKWRIDAKDCGCNSKKYDWSCVLDKK